MLSVQMHANKIFIKKVSDIRRTVPTSLQFISASWKERIARLSIFASLRPLLSGRRVSPMVQWWTWWFRSKLSRIILVVQFLLGL